MGMVWDGKLGIGEGKWAMKMEGESGCETTSHSRKKYLLPW